MSKKLLIVNQSAGYLTIDVANSALQWYSDVAIVYGDIRNLERRLDSRIKVSKINSYNRSSTLKRLLSWTEASLRLLLLLVFKYRDYEVMYYSNPPFSYFVSLFIKRKFSIVVFDVYPDALKTLGINDVNLLYKFWVRVNKKLFKKAAQITTLSEGMKSLIEEYADSNKIYACSPWGGSDKFKRIEPQNNIFVKKYGLENKFVVMYSGNLGQTHPVEKIINMAILTTHISDIVYVIVGEGAKKKLIEGLIKENKLNNVILLSWQPAKLLSHSLSAADIAIITLDENAAKLSVPSKTFNLMAVGAPLLCLVGEDSELAKIVYKYENGYCRLPDDIKSNVNCILELYKNNSKKSELSSNSIVASRSFHYSNSKKYFDYVSKKA